jgi:hypothetical protein
LEEEVLLFEEKFEEEKFEEEKFEEEKVEEKPICSFTSRKGLTIPELKKIAKQYSLSLSGNKEDLCKRLAELDLVRIIN